MFETSEIVGDTILSNHKKMCGLTLFTESVNNLDIKFAAIEKAVPHNPPFISSIGSHLKTLFLNVFSQWIPSHIERLVSEWADHLAKPATPSNQTHHQLSWGRECLLSQWCTLWSNERTGRQYFKIQTHPFLNHYKGLKIVQIEQVILSRIKMGHFSCRNCLHCFGCEEDPPCKLCGMKEENIQLLLQLDPSARRIFLQSCGVSRRLADNIWSDPGMERRIQAMASLPHAWQTTTNKNGLQENR